MLHRLKMMLKSLLTFARNLRCYCKCKPCATSNPSNLDNAHTKQSIDHQKLSNGLQYADYCQRYDILKPGSTQYRCLKLQLAERPSARLADIVSVVTAQHGRASSGGLPSVSG
jgi:hypothetical protein